MSGDIRVKPFRHLQCSECGAWFAMNYSGPLPEHDCETNQILDALDPDPEWYVETVGSALQSAKATPTSPPTPDLPQSQA